MDTLFIGNNDVSNKNELYWETLKGLCLIVMDKGIDTVIEDLELLVSKDEELQSLNVE